MRYLIPTLDPQLQLDATADAGDCVIKRTGSPAQITLTRPAVAALMLCDGRRTVEIVEACALQLGLSLPPTFLEQLLSALAKVGFLTLSDAVTLPHWLLPDTEHTCDGCGRSCQGHLVGPLPRDEIQRIQAIWPRLVEKTPRLRGLRPLIQLPDRGQGVFLECETGQCVFLDPDKRCAIHKHFGPEHKPSICRLFPFVRVLTERGLRLGVNTHCFRHHVHAEPAAAGPAARWALEGQLAMLPPLMLDRDVHSLLPETPWAREQAHQIHHREALMLTYLASDDPCLSGFLQQLLEAPRQAQAMTAISSPALQHARRLLTRFASRWTPEDTSMEMLLQQPDGLGASLREIADLLRDLPTTPEPLPVQRRDEAHLLDVLRRQLWIRDTLAFERPAISAGAMTLGWTLALMASRDHDPETRFERCGERLTAWGAWLKTDDLHTKLFDATAEAHAWLETLDASILH